MIVNRGVTRMRTGPSGGRIFITFFALAAALNSIVCESTKNSLAIEKSSNCSGEYSGYQYTIASPNYPENYPENRDCVYKLRGSRLAKCDQVFHLQFLDFALPPSENCDRDYLEIGDRSLFCGSVIGIRRYPGKNNSLTLRFHSAEGRGGKGFKILVTTSPCAEPQIGEQDNTEPTETSATTAAHKSTSKTVIGKKIGTLDSPESVELREAGISYPVYHPEVDFTVEDNRQSRRGDQTPLKIENFPTNHKNIVNDAEPVSSFELPVRQSQLFRDSTTAKVAIVTPTPVKLQKTQSPRISAYLFVPPASEQDSKNTGAITRYSSVIDVSKVTPKSEFDNFITPPPTEFLLPTEHTTVFRDSEVTSDTRKLQPVEDQRKVNQKFIVPARSYGVPFYPSVQVSEVAINKGEVLENPRGNIDCQGKNHFGAELEIDSEFRAIDPVPIDNAGSGALPGFGGNYYPAATYGAPGFSYPTTVPKVNVGFTPSPSYGPPAGNYPGGVIGRPNDWIPSFVPSNGNPNSNNNVGNRYPNYIPNPGATYPGSGGGYQQCCRTEYTGQRFLLASPGFPGLFYSGNSYECVYTIRPYSPNTCQIRYNFHFFNHGADDPFCTRGYVEIDGRRICGCKRGLSVVSPVVTTFPKTIGVKYSGYPRSKFNGFLIEAIQEPCSNSYPYLSRSKKDVGNLTHEEVASNLEGISKITNSSSSRKKRNLGYSYPKPNFGLSEEPGGSHAWNSGSSINTAGIHQIFNQGGIGGNLFAPISTCQALSFFDWINAAKDVYLRGARCVRNGGSGNINPGYPGGSVPGQSPGYPGGGGSGTIVPGYPGGGSGTIIPGYPGSGGSGTINPGYPGGGSGTIIPGYPDGGGSGTINPGYPGGGGSGTINPGYPGGGSGTINPGYPGSGGWNVPSKCEDINVIEGIISSPQYPTNYPNNVNKCFRFYKAPDSCQLEVVFLDFDLENSNGCTKDYVAFSGQNRRYCGRSLAGSRSLIDISRTSIVDLYFVTDGYGSGRGFSAGFSQISCRGLVNR